VEDIISRFPRFLTEIRKRILVTLSFFALATFGGFFFYEKIIRFLINILSLKGINIVFTSPFQFINLATSCGVATGLVISFPLLIFQILSFLKPALREKEYKMLVKFLPFALFLFLTGFIFGLIIMKWQINIFLARSVSLGIGNILDVSRLLTVVLLTSVFMGIGFQFPIVLLLLLKVGLIKHEQLARGRQWVYLASFIFAIILPPDSILADILLALPLIALFELTLILNKTTRKNLLA